MDFPRIALYPSAFASSRGSFFFFFFFFSTGVTENQNVNALQLCMFLEVRSLEILLANRFLAWKLGLACSVDSEQSRVDKSF